MLAFVTNELKNLAEKFLVDLTVNCYSWNQNMESARFGKIELYSVMKENGLKYALEFAKKAYNLGYTDHLNENVGIDNDEE